VTIAVLVYIAAFSLLHIALFAGLLAERAREKRLVQKAFSTAAAVTPLVSIIVPLRNEAEALPKLLACLKAQTRANVEYVFVDDASFDASPALLAAFKAASKDAVVIVTIEEAVTDSTNPDRAFCNRKQAALALGIAQSHGEILLFTDADCEFSPDWARYMAAAASVGNVGVVLGPVYKQPSKPPEAATILADYQCFDHLVRGMYIAGAVGLGAASGGFGNNIAVRREALDGSGGYESIGDSVT
jgi:glycosyltransferase involved in cell wall biosynthesis